MNRKLTAIILLFISAASCSTPPVDSERLAAKIEHGEKLLVNQVGFTADGGKRALWLNPTAEKGQQVSVIDRQNGETLLFCDVGPVEMDEDSGHSGRWVDCSKLKRPGEYLLRAGNVASLPFAVDNQVLKLPLMLLLRSYYLQRCGKALNDSLTGIHHQACHVNDAILAHDDDKQQAGTAVESLGGWHDAGDYGKYIATTAVTAARLLHVYEAIPQLFADGSLQIPESGNGLSDLLDEVQIALDWMLTMQRKDGAVYRKLSGDQWPPLVVPEKDSQQRYIYGVSSPETAKFAAVMAMAARIYPHDKSVRYLQAARQAWAFLQTIEEQEGQRFDWYQRDDGGSGPYKLTEIDTEETLKTDVDDRYWAAAELYITTGEADFHQYLKTHVDDVPYTLFEWKNPAPLAMSNYLWQKRQPADPLLLHKIRNKIIKRAAAIALNYQQGIFRLANRRFVWGSNKMTAEEGITALHAYRITNHPEYLRIAEDQLDYLLGRNPFEQTFITGIGSRPVTQVHHIFARSAAIDIPGLLVGGPNEKAQSNIAPKGQGILSYVDDRRSYATNEYAIDYNAAIIGLITELMFLQHNG